MLGNNRRCLVYFSFVLMACLFSLNAPAQNDFNFKDPTTGISNRVYVQYTDSIVETFYYRGGKKIKTNDELLYFWYAARDIKHTRGAFEGKLLHGKYTMFYYNKDLLAKGEFKYGLKYGVWKSWYKGGEIKKKEKWCKGRIVGTAYYYSAAGVIQQKKKYTDKKGSRIITNYNAQGGILSKEYYSKNKLVNTITYQLNSKGKYVVSKPEKEKKTKIKKTKEKESKKKTKEKKAPKVKEKKSKTPKIKIQKFRQVVPGGIGT